MQRLKCCHSGDIKPHNKGQTNMNFSIYTIPKLPQNNNNIIRKRSVSWLN